jgi:hypothetical protein
MQNFKPFLALLFFRDWLRFDPCYFWRFVVEMRIGLHFTVIFTRGIHVTCWDLCITIFGQIEERPPFGLDIVDF